MFTYLLATLPLLLIWFWIYKHERFQNVKKEMLITSIICAFGSFISSYYLWTIDWWRPETITHTRAGIEDLFSGFSMGGIMSGVYYYLFHKHIILYQKGNGLPWLKIGILAVLFCVFVYALIHVGLTSFWACMGVLIIFLSYMLFDRVDLVGKSFYSGIFTLLIASSAYATIYFIDYGWADRTYLYFGLSGIKIATFPVEEFIFWFIAGCCFGVWYEFAMKGKIK